MESESPKRLLTLQEVVPDSGPVVDGNDFNRAVNMRCPVCHDQRISHHRGHYSWVCDACGTEFGIHPNLTIVWRGQP